MYRNDSFLNEIEKLARVIARLMGLKDDGKEEEFIQLADTTLLNEYNISLPKLLELTIEDFKLKLDEENYNANKLDALAQLLYLQATPLNATPGVFLTLKKVLAIFDILEQKHHLQSLENINKRKLIHQFLNKIYE